MSNCVRNARQVRGLFALCWLAVTLALATVAAAAAGSHGHPEALAPNAGPGTTPAAACEDCEQLAGAQEQCGLAATEWAAAPGAPWAGFEPPPPREWRETPPRPPPIGGGPCPEDS